jgi:preprotein translocase subunit SecA
MIYLIKNSKLFLWKLNELQENTETQFNEIRKTVYEQHEKINKEIKIIFKRTKQILELKNSINEMKNATEYQHQKRPKSRQNSELDRNS